MDTFEEARKKISDWLNTPDPNKTPERTYQDRLEDHYESGRLQRPTPKGGVSPGNGAEIKSLQNPRAIKKGGKIKGKR
jgi:hypothetical protein